MNRTPLLLACSLALLQACASAPQPDSGMQPVQGKAAKEAPQAQAEPELTLNLPDQACDCSVPAPARDLTFLDRGFDALMEGDHIEALQHFQRYQRLEKSSLAEFEAGISIAYLATLQDSPLYDPDQARRSLRELNRIYRKTWDVDQRVSLLHQSLESFRVMYRHVDDLQDANDTLREDLAKREEALKRLRELTLGQRESRQ